MKFIPALALSIGLLVSAAMPAQAAPRQYILVVAEGVSPQVLEIGKGYLRKADEDPELSTSFDTLMETGKVAPVGMDAISQMKGLLEKAEASGFKTGLVTTSDVSVVAPLFYEMTAEQIGAPNAKYEFLAGGGRANLARAGASLKAAGGSYLSGADDVIGEIKGRVLAAQAEGDLSYAIDRAPENEAGLNELATLAMDTLGADESPYVLVVHDTLAKRAIDTRDTPALVEQFRELNLVLGDALARREDNADLSVAALMTGGAITPRFSGTDDAFFTLSTLTHSFAGLNQALKGADVATITRFVDAEEGDYRGWRLSDSDKARIAAGTLSPETAARASYEPALKFEYAAAPTEPFAYALGFDAGQGLVPALLAAVSQAAK